MGNEVNENDRAQEQDSDGFLDTHTFMPLIPRYENMHCLKNQSIILNTSKMIKPISINKSEVTKNMGERHMSMSLQALKNRKQFMMKNENKIKQLSKSLQQYIQSRGDVKSQIKICPKDNSDIEPHPIKLKPKRIEMSMDRALRDNLKLLKEIQQEMGISS